MEKFDLILCRSDESDGGWSLHAPGTTDADIASGDAPCLLTGEAERTEGGWSRPDAADYRHARDVLATQHPRFPEFQAWMRETRAGVRRCPGGVSFPANFGYWLGGGRW